MHMLMWSSSNGTGFNSQISAHVINESWDESSVTWNNQPGYDSTVLDYAFIPVEDIDRNIAQWIDFDITGIVKSWIEGSANNGVMIKANNENAYARCWFNSERYIPGEDFTYRYPVISIDYRNNNGLENYWSYTSATAGNAGTMHVNDYTGNPVFVAPLFTSPSKVMPLSLYAVYNGYVSELTHVAGKDSSSKSVIGFGWRLNVQQTLLPADKFGLSGESLETYPYVYTDADGTDHYFIKKTENGTTTYIDEDGLGLTLTFGTTMDHHYFITDNDDNVMAFNAAGNLRRIANPNNQRIAIVYHEASGEEGIGKRINYVVDGTDHKYTFHYEGTDNVQYISDDYNRKIQFIRASSGVLTNIKYYDGLESTFAYKSSSPYSMVTVTDDAGYRLAFDYTSPEKGQRVS